MPPRPLEPELDADTTEITTISIRGAREHNLKGIDLDIPRDRLVVITGLSGSGKSSIAFDTVFAEGQRRYVESLSSYARQFLGVMKKPDIDTIEGLSPAISIEQKSTGMSPRSTVGTVTEIYDYLRLLFAKIGTQYCVECQIPVQQQTVDQIIGTLLALGVGTRIQILSPVVKGRKGHYREQLESFRRQGYTRVRIDGELTEITQGMQLARYKTHTIELVIDRLVIEAEPTKRLTDSIEMALQLGEGGLTVLHESEPDTWKDRFYSTSYACPQCGTSYETPAPNMFSFNSPFGACDSCDGLGQLQDFDPGLVIPDASLSLASGGIAPLGARRDTWLWKQVLAWCDHHKVNVMKPVGEIDAALLDDLLHGTGKARYDTSLRGTNVKHQFMGVLPSLRHQYEQSASSSVRKSIEKFFATVTCRECNGSRLKTPHMNVRVADENIVDLCRRDIVDARTWFLSLSDKLSERQNHIAFLILKEINQRLEFLDDVGLSYLTLERSARSLSGGESQRIRLASQIGSHLVGVTYVLDEPSIGLHQHDNRKLIESLKRLRDIGNTVLVVEHDREMIEESDTMIDVGPGAGVHGGSIVAVKSAQEIRDIISGHDVSDSPSITLQYLSGQRRVFRPELRRAGNGKTLELKGARGNNLRGVDLQIPLGTFTCVTGMSGSGKSSLINDTLYPILAARLHRSELKPLEYDSINGLEFIDKVIEIDQTPIGRTPRSNPATYTGLFTLIRDFFTMLPEAKIRGYQAGRFSFNVSGGRCEECEGVGLRKIEMNFLPDVYVSCETCGGKRYNAETLMVRFKGKSISDVLEMTVEEARAFFSDIPRISTRLQTLMDVGLTYITLGQQATTLSGGEAQRVKLATELAKSYTGKTLYLLDEPTTGLHFEDISVLMKLLHRLVERGNTVVVIEHNLDVIVSADHIIDLGPGGGREGGQIIASGTPEHVASSDVSLTGRYLSAELRK
ncbi:MAG: excinuclease ABC subunit UvrA [Candidatus Kapabacteria bacterium]|nr:excinuclease ABC subunit UvrA [Candidatus Kapabacteria bacterium]